MTIKTIHPTVGLGFELNLDTLTVAISYNFDYTVPFSTISSAANKPYSGQQLEASLAIKLPCNFSIETDAQHHINSERTNGYAIHYFLWNASINKTFFKKDNVILSFIGSDILNQKISTGRIIQDNVVTDYKTTVISRYFLLKFVYKFNSSTKRDNNEYF